MVAMRTKHFPKEDNSTKVLKHQVSYKSAKWSKAAPHRFFSQKNIAKCAKMTLTDEKNKVFLRKTTCLQNVIIILM